MTWLGGATGFGVVIAACNRTRAAPGRTRYRGTREPCFFTNPSVLFKSHREIFWSITGKFWREHSRGGICDDGMGLGAWHMLGLRSSTWTISSASEKVYFHVLVLGLLPAMHKAYSGLYTQGSLMHDFETIVDTWDKTRVSHMLIKGRHLILWTLSSLRKICVYVCLRLGRNTNSNMSFYTGTNFVLYIMHLNIHWTLFKYLCIM